MKICKIIISDNLKRVVSRKDFEENYINKFFTQDELFILRSYVKQLCIDYSVRMTHFPPEGWDPINYSYTVLWETDKNLKEFVEKFFNHTLFKKNISKFIDEGFSISDPIFL